VPAIHDFFELLRNESYWLAWTPRLQGGSGMSRFLENRTDGLVTLEGDSWES
jgi:hypothetical protein